MILNLFARNGKSVVIFMIALIGNITGAFAQDPEFSQFFANPIYTNPAFAGSSTVARGVMNYRSQWPGIAGTFNSFTASYDEHFDVINGGIGIIIMNDEAGVGTLRTTSISGIYSYQIPLSKNVTARLSVQAGFQQKSIEFGKLLWYDQIIAQKGFVRPTQETPITENPLYANFSSGAIVYSERFYGGVAIHNMNEPNQGFFKTTTAIVPMRYTFHTGLIIPLSYNRDINKSTNIWPNVLYMQQAKFNQLNIGMYFNKGALVAGSYYRRNSVNSDAIIMVLGLKLPKLRIGFSYDATLSDARPGAKQSYEVSLAFELRKRTPKKTIKVVRCPEF